MELLLPKVYRGSAARFVAASGALPIDEADKVCPKCGGRLAEWAEQFEQSDEIYVVERSYRIVRHKRLTLGR